MIVIDNSSNASQLSLDEFNSQNYFKRGWGTIKQIMVEWWGWRCPILPTSESSSAASLFHLHLPRSWRTAPTTMVTTPQLSTKASSTSTPQYTMSQAPLTIQNQAHIIQNPLPTIQNQQSTSILNHQRTIPNPPGSILRPIPTSPNRQRIAILNPSRSSLNHLSIHSPSSQSQPTSPLQLRCTSPPQLMLTTTLVTILLSITLLLHLSTMDLFEGGVVFDFPGFLVPQVRHAEASSTQEVLLLPHSDTQPHPQEVLLLTNPNPDPQPSHICLFANPLPCRTQGLPNLSILSFFLFLQNINWPKVFRPHPTPHHPIQYKSKITYEKHPEKVRNRMLVSVILFSLLFRWRRWWGRCPPCCRTSHPPHPPWKASLLQGAFTPYYHLHHPLHHHHHHPLQHPDPHSQYQGQQSRSTLKKFLIQDLRDNILILRRSTNYQTWRTTICRRKPSCSSSIISIIIIVFFVATLLSLPQLFTLSNPCVKIPDMLLII